jgi:hypothetical protein
MLLDLAPVRQGRFVHARSFAGLMEMYEQNYIRLRNIAPDLAVADEMISTVPGHQDLYLSITRRCKYTTMLRMTYQFAAEGHGAEGAEEQTLFEPDLHLKVYHDARVIEVQQFQSRTYGPLNIANMIEQKWMMNRFLYKWLGYCLHQGHYFHPMQHLKANNK